MSCGGTTRFAYKTNNAIFGSVQSLLIDVQCVGSSGHFIGTM